MDAAQLTTTDLLKILDITRHLAEQREVQPLLEYVADVVFTIIPAEQSLIVLFADDGTLHIPAARTRTGAQLDDADDQVSRSILDQVRTTLLPTQIDDALADIELTRAYSVRRLGLRSVMCAPLVSRGRALGAIYVENRMAGGKFTDDNLVPLVLFANQIVVALENARMLEALEATVAERTRDLQAANDQLAHMVQQRSQQLRATTRALRTTESHYELISENTNDLIALLSTEGKIQYASPSYSRLLSYAAAQLVGMRWLDLVHADDRAVMSFSFQQALAHGSAHSIARLLPAGQAQHAPWLEASFSVANRPSLRYVVVIARDITARREIESRLQQTQKMEALGRLAGSIAHDFNNLLTVIHTSAEILVEKLVRNPHLLSDVDAIRAASARATTLTRQLLAFARREPAVPKLMQLDATVLDIRNLLQRLVGPRVVLKINIGAELWPVRADRGQIEQVIMNMVANARDAMPHGGRLTIDLINVTYHGGESGPHIRPGEYVRIAIADTGVGMTPDLQAHIFEPFFTTKLQDQGTGLGLATCYGIITQSGGTISVASTPGVGTTFTIVLPRASDALEKAQALKAGPQQVLLVGPNRSMRARMVRHLQQQGYSVTAASNVAHALRLAANSAERIDLLVSALTLPRTNGAALALELCRSHPAMKVLLLAESAEHKHHLDGRIEQMKNEIGIAILPHPWTLADLGAMVQGLLDQGRSR